MPSTPPKPLPASPTRRGICPDLEHPMQTGDGLLARLTPATGALSAAQLQRLAELAAIHGNGLLEVSNRGNLQIRGLSTASAPRFAQAINAAGIDAQCGIAIDVSPLSGLDAAALINASPLAKSIRSALEQAPWRHQLAPKMSVVLDDGGRISLADLTADIRLTAFASSAGGDVRWRLAIGGRADQARVLGEIANEDTTAAAAIVMALLERLATKGPQARGRDLVAADLSCLVGFKLSAPATGALPASAAPTTRTPAAPPPTPAAPLGIYPLSGHALADSGGHADGARGFGYSVGFGLEFGTISASNLSAFAQTVAQLQASQTASPQNGQTPQIRLAPSKIILVLLHRLKDCHALQQRAAALGLICKPEDPRRRFITCAGAPACASAHINTHDVARAILRDRPHQNIGDAAQQSTASSTRPIHISGCTKCCARPGNVALDIIATAQGIEISHHGSPRARHVAVADISRTIIELEHAP